MKKNNEIIGRRVFPALIMMCMTSFIAVYSSLSFDTYAIKYNDTTTQITTMSYISTEDLLKIANVPTEDVSVQEVNSVYDGLTTLEVNDTFPINVIVDGKTLEITAISDTVENVLKNSDIEISEHDILSLDKTEILNEGQTLEIIRVSKEYETYESEINYTTVRHESSTLGSGATAVKTKGSNGLKLVTTEKVYHNGVLVSEGIVEEEILEPAVSEVLEYGPMDLNQGVTVTDGEIATASGDILSYSKIIDVEATAYSTEGWTSKHTASGTLARVGAIAVDPRVIPLGSKLFITSPDGSSWVYGTAVAEDTGGAIKGNKIDLFFNTQQECINFGRQSAKVYVLS